MLPLSAVVSAVYYTLLGAFLFKCFLKLIYSPCRSKVCLVGKTALVTGGNKGLGYETSLGLAARGCKVIIACRGNADKVREDIITRTHNPNIVTKYLDLNSLDSVRQFCKEINETEEKIDILINNAGISVHVNTFTKDGLHPTMQTNLFGSFLLTHLLIELLKKAGNARIIFVSSIAAYFNNLTLENVNVGENQPLNVTSVFKIYANSKVGQIIVSNELAERLKPFGITSNAVHPGIVMTGIIDNIIQLNIVSKFVEKCFFFFANVFYRTPEEGAQRILKLAISNKFKDVTGGFLWYIKYAPPCTKDKEFSRKIYRQIEEYVKLTDNEKI